MTRSQRSHLDGAKRGPKIQRIATTMGLQHGRKSRVSRLVARVLLPRALLEELAELLTGSFAARKASIEIV
jgi:hypothetical protein